MIRLMILFLFLSGCAGEMPQVVIYKYDYRTKPNYHQTVYDSGFDDPSLVVFKNNSYRKVKVEVDGKKAIILEPYGDTPDIHLNIGKHRIKISIQKPTAVFGIWETTRRFTIHIHPEGRSQIFYIHD